jgi:hypothetical protein
MHAGYNPVFHHERSLEVTGQYAMLSLARTFPAEAKNPDTLADHL